MDLLTVPHVTQSFDRRSADSWQFVMGAGVVVAAPRFSSCTAELLQNCDLPPPAKVFSPVGDNARRTTPPLKQERHKVSQCDGESGQSQNLMRALQLSQTRAREAEKKALETNIKKEQITALFLEDSLRLHAVQQWVRLLEMEISLLKQTAAAEEERNEAVGTMTWCLAVALCLGIAGAGFMLGRYIF